ncbi:hypothetical protein [Pseudomonas sp. 22 E 5]|nr:hypothetical protein [Pseudomonas sp. 22 E 5]
MKAITLAEVFAHAALSLKYGDPDKSAPITESQMLIPRRFDDSRPELWSVFNRTQENLTTGGLHGRSANGRRRRPARCRTLIPIVCFPLHAPSCKCFMYDKQIICQSY